MSNNLRESYEMFKKAFYKLKEFIDTDNGSEKDRAAIIHAYEYTFELWWKSLQKYLQQYETVTEHGPGATIRNAFQFGIIEDGEDYMDLLRDRNLIAHTYKENTAIEIHDRMTVADLAYTILASFNSLAYHLYNIKYKKVRYDCIVDDEFPFDDEKIIVRHKDGIAIIVGNNLTITKLLDEELLINGDILKLEFR